VCAWHINAKILIYSNGFIKCYGLIIIIIDKAEWRAKRSNGNNMLIFNGL